MTAVWRQPGNPASVHRAGQRARRQLETAREQVAAALGAEPAEIIFTSGATEADNLALRGLEGGQGRLITSELEHPAVRDTARQLAAAGREVTFLAGHAGVITKQQVQEAVQPGDLVALMLVNNETGVLTDIRHIGMLTRRQGALLFCDAVQGFGTERMDVRHLNVDALAISGHKVGGPSGVGALWVRDGVKLAPQLHGGAQERGLRPGTSNLPAIVGLGVCAELVSRQQEAERDRLQSLHAHFEELVLRLPGVRVNALEQPRSVKHSSVTFSGVNGEDLLLSLDAAGVQVSAGSACSAGSLAASHVLLNMGLPEQEARSSLRFSFGHTTTRSELTEAVVRLERVLEQVRQFSQVQD